MDLIRLYVASECGWFVGPWREESKGVLSERVESIYMRARPLMPKRSTIN